ncbi:MAG: hypothetical protein ACRDKE_00345 [Solirubrobacterales bacterium]
MKSPIKLSRKNSQTTVLAAPTNNATQSTTAFPVPPPAPVMTDSSETIDLERRRAQLSAKVAELQWDLGGLVYEMATRNRMRPEVLVKRAAALQDADAELGEIERILRMERTGVAALCLTCGAPHSSGAVYCWQCGGSLLEKVAGASIAAPRL